jgi:sarcosine oxidase subunit gamma
MAEATPTAVSPLADRTRPIGGSDHAGIVLAEKTGLSLVNLRGAGEAFLARVEGTLGVRPPDAPNTVTATDAVSILWLGPDEWLVVAEDGDSTGVCAKLEKALAGVHRAVVDLSDNYAVIALSGHAATWVLAKGWSQDLHPSVFKAGQCSQGMLSHAQIVLEKTGDEHFRLYTRPSFAAYLWDWLVDAAFDTGVRIEAG